MTEKKSPAGNSPKKTTTKKRPRKSRRQPPKPKPTPAQVIEYVGADNLEIVPGQYDESVKYIARLLYISGSASLPVISKEMGIPEGTLRYWYTKGQWAKLSREVQRFAAKDSVLRARKSMSRYAKGIDDALNVIAEKLENDLAPTQANYEPLTKEKDILQLLLEVYKVKIALFKTLAHGAYRKSLSPHPDNMVFSGTEEEPPNTLMPTTAMEKLMNAVPAHMREAAKYVLALDPDEDLSSDVVDAITCLLDAKIASSEDEESSNSKKELPVVMED